MRKYLIITLLAFATLWIVPHALGRWNNMHSNDTVKPSSISPGFNYSLLQNSSEENKTDLIELTIRYYNPRLDEAIQQQIIMEIISASKENNLDPFLVTAVIAAESSFKPQAKSDCGARGLMQLTRVVLPALGVTDPFNVEQNIQGGCKFLGELYQRFGNTTLALAAYNAGPTRVARLKRVPHITETQNYVKKVQRIATVLFQHFLTSIEDNSFNPITYIAGLSLLNGQHPLTWSITNNLYRINITNNRAGLTVGYIPTIDSYDQSLTTKLSKNLIFSSGNYLG